MRGQRRGGSGIRQKEGNNEGVVVGVVGRGSREARGGGEILRGVEGLR